MTVEAGADRLLADLEARARAEVDAVQAEMRAELDRIHAAAVDQCAELRRNATASCAAELAPLHGAARFAARQAARRVVLEAQHAAIRRVLGAVPTAACGAGNSCGAPDSVVAARVADALSYLGDAPSELRCAVAILAAVQSSVGRSGVRVVPDRAIAAGIRVATADGRLVVDDTLDAWLTRATASLGIWIRDAIARATEAPVHEPPQVAVHA